MVGAVLSKDQGICHELFAGGEEGEEAEPDGGEEGDEKKDTGDLLNTCKYKYVPEVVREPKIHY